MQDRAIPFDVRFAIYTPKPASPTVLLPNLACVQFCLLSGHPVMATGQFIVFVSSARPALPATINYRYKEKKHARTLNQMRRQKVSRAFDQSSEAF
tara:strand:+ start:108 stop:395 length:288 start_codon:yes stop_codon:yes gene_type:complete